MSDLEAWLDRKWAKYDLSRPLFFYSGLCSCCLCCVLGLIGLTCLAVANDMSDSLELYEAEAHNLLLAMEVSCNTSSFPGTPVFQLVSEHTVYFLLNMLGPEPSIFDPDPSQSLNLIRVQIPLNETFWAGVGVDVQRFGPEPLPIPWLRCKTVVLRHKQGGASPFWPATQNQGFA